jgi:hypothetical protein
LIEELAGARPAPAYRSPGLLAGAWLASTWVLVALATNLAAPLRPGWLGQLGGSLQFAGEGLLGVVAGGAVIFAAVRLAFPQSAAQWPRCVLAMALLLLWGAGYVLALWFPALEPSMLGKRPFCVFEVLVYGTPPLVAGLLVLRRRAAFQRAATGALVGAAAGAVPGLIMQVACMYLPEHILLFHVAPIAALALLGAVLGRLMLPRV